MRQMQKSLAQFAKTAVGLWLVGSVVAILYANQQHIPTHVWAALLPAILLEVTMYAATGFSAIREWVSRLKGKLPAVMALSAIVPYTIYSVMLGSFQLESLGTLILLAVIVGAWYLVAPKHVIFDLLFLTFMAGIFLSKVFPAIYANPAGKPPLDFLGRMMWIRLGIFAVTSVRGMEGVGFGFVPRAQDWWIGARYFLFTAVLVLPVAMFIGFTRPKNVEFSGKTGILFLATFVGMLWVVSLGEEFFFRGLLQQWMQKITGSALLGIAITSAIFGAVHLPMRGFPNYKYAFIAGLLGVFCGLAYARSGSIRASMVTHALAATTLRVFFS